MKFNYLKYTYHYGISRKKKTRKKKFEETWDPCWKRILFSPIYIRNWFNDADLGILINTYTYNTRRKHPNYKITNCSKSKARTKKRKDVAVFFTNEVTGNPCGLCMRLLIRLRGMELELELRFRLRLRLGLGIPRLRRISLRFGYKPWWFALELEVGHTVRLEMEVRLKPSEARLIEP